MITQWEKEIYAAHCVRQEVGQADTLNLWAPHSFPEIAATEDELSAVERALGHQLDPQYRAFLARANGWKGFFHKIDLLGSRELPGGPHVAKAREILATLEPLRPLCGAASAELLPIAVSRNSIDVFAMGRPTSDRAGEVFWLAGQLIESFADFSEYFLAMVAYIRREIEHLKAQPD